MTEALVRMPKLADTLVEGTVGQWLKQVGETVAAGEPLASIETDKVSTELTAPVAGTLVALLVPAGQAVPIETAIARIAASEETTTGDSAQATTADSVSAAVESVPQPGAQRRTTPLAARLLAEHGLRPDDIGVPPAGARRITKDDVLRHLAAAAPLPTEGRTRGEDVLVPLSSMRRAIAEHMTAARQSIPHGQTVMAADVSRLVEWRDSIKAEFERTEHGRLTLTVCFVVALAQALAKTGAYGPIDLGVAVAVDNGLVVPVIRGVDSLSLGEAARRLQHAADNARARQLTTEDVQGGVMTVTNVGSFGNLLAAPIVPLGQLGIFGPGLVERRPVPGPHGTLRAGWQCLLTLMFDRKRIDEFAADRLLGSVVDHLARLSGQG